MSDELLSELREKFDRSIKHFEQELIKIRSGRAHPSLLETVQAEVYGQKQPIHHIARVLASDARTLSVTPYDPATLASIAKAIREDQSLGLNPVDDGKVIHVSIPDMTSERRAAAVKLLGAKAEECRVALRAARHGVLDQAKELSKAGEISEDEAKRVDQAVGKELESASSRIDELVELKTKDLMTV